MYHLISKSAKANQLNEKTKENVQNNFKHIQLMKFHISKENKVDKMTTQDTSLEQKYKD